MAANDKSTRPPVTWRLLFPFVFLEYLNTYTCFLYILVYKLLFFTVFILCLHLLEGFPIFLMLVTVQQWCVGIGTFSCRYISRYPQSCNFFMKGKTLLVGFVFGFQLIFFVIICFWYILWVMKILMQTQDLRIALPAFLLVSGI